LFKKLANKNYIIEFLWVVLGNTINIFGMLLILKLFTKKLSPQDYGIYYLSLTISIFINQIFFGPIGNGISRYFTISKEENNLPMLISNSLILCKKLLIIIGFFYLTTLLVLILLQKYNYIFIFSTTVVYSVLSGFTMIIYTIQNINRERKLVAYFQVVETIIKIIITYLILYFFNQNASTALLSITISTLFIFFLQILYLKRYNSSLLNFNIQLINKSLTKKILQYSFPFAIWGIFAWGQISSDRWFLQSFTDSNTVAKYAVLFQIGYYPLTILMGYIVQVITPVLFNAAGNGEDKIRNQKSTKINIRIALTSLIITILSFILVIIFHQYISNLLTSSKYADVSKYLPYMILSGGIFATSQILSLDFMSHIKVNQLLAIKIATSILGIFISYIFIFLYKFNGAIFSSLCYSILYLIVISFFIYSRKFQSEKNYFTK